MGRKEKAILAGVARPKRNANIIAYKEKHPKSSWRAIGRIFKISRQRAHQIWQREIGRRALETLRAQFSDVSAFIYGNKGEANGEPQSKV